MTTCLRIVELSTADGPLNMARDEAVLEAVAAGAAPPTLRFFTWLGRWLSIGMAQSAGAVDRQALAATGTGLVRRPSGGTAVLHVDQVAWSLILPANHPLAPPDILLSYRRQAALTLETLARLGVAARGVSREEARAPLPDQTLEAACFGALAPSEIVVGTPPRKLVGWGQVRRRGVVLHHAVLPLRFDAPSLAALLVVDRERLARALSARVIGLDEAGGMAVGAQDVAAAFAASLEADGFAGVIGGLTTEEEERAAALVADRYGNEAWTARR